LPQGGRGLIGPPSDSNPHPQRARLANRLCFLAVPPAARRRGHAYLAETIRGVIAMSSPVTRIPAADSAAAEAHFAASLTFETDCWDVHVSLSEGHTDFVLLDVRSP